MTKADLIEKVAQNAAIIKKDAAAAVNAVFDVIIDTLVKGEKLTILGFGTFETRERAARMGRNPATGEKLKIPAAIVPAFKPSKVLKEKVNE